ncbi:hypothetical protein BJX70DRAFT_357439 [Aspergillus crustosus]
MVQIALDDLKSYNSWPVPACAAATKPSKRALCLSLLSLSSRRNISISAMSFAIFTSCCCWISVAAYSAMPRVLCAKLCARL